MATIREECEEMIERISVEIENLPRTPPEIPNAIRGLDNLQIGKRYKNINTEFGDMGSFTLLGFEMDPNDGGMWLLVEKVLSMESLYETKHSAADMGVEPYGNGGWNDVNYLVSA